MNILNIQPGVAPGVNEDFSSGAASQRDDFLQLLVTQMRYQDPLNPMSGSDFTAQLAQFSSLEELQNIGGTMDRSIEANILMARSINNTLASTLIGKTITAADSKVHFGGNDDVDVNFQLQGNAHQVTVDILASNGEVVRSLEGFNLDMGTESISWDGKDNTGNRVPEGDYSVVIRASTQDGTPVLAQPVYIGRVSGVRYINGNPMLVVNEREVPFGSVIEIHESSSGAGSNGGDDSWISNLLELIK